MKALKILLAILGTLLLIVLALGLIAPKSFHIERSIVMDAPKDVIFPYLKNFATFKNWSPWAEMDPNMKTSINGTDGTVGAIYSWEGNEQVGKGKQVITEIKELESITTHMSIVEPWQSESDITNTVESAEEGTKVKWIMAGTNGFIESIFMLFADLDGEVGSKFEVGLEKLKRLAEADKEANDRKKRIVEEVDFPGRTFLGAREKIAVTGIQQFYLDKLPKVFASCQAQGIKMAGMPGGLFFNWDEAKGQTDMAAVIPVAEGSRSAGKMEVFKLPAGKALLINYYGDYSQTVEAHEVMEAYLKKNQLEQKWPVIEEYVTDPGQQPDTSQWLTRIYYLL